MGNEVKKLFALACTLLVEGRAPRQSTAATEASGVRLRGIDGKTYDFGEMRGSVILVSFGANWYLPCRGELAALEQLKKEYAGRLVRFLG